MAEHEKWLDETLPLYNSLTLSIITIAERLLRSNNIQFLGISGRTKDKKSILEKITRKNYKTPEKDLTDLSGIRIILYSESDVDKVTKLIEESFKVDKDNSSNKDDLLAKNEIGYRSVHIVCDLGKERVKLPEFKEFKDLKFEFQIRTVLQHAWAELSHDRDYKFKKQLPPKLERKLYLYAGMLEIIDNGLDELSNNIDQYIIEQSSSIEKGELNQTIDSLNLEEFYEDWYNKNKPPLYDYIEIDAKSINDLVLELKQFGIETLKELDEIIPSDYTATLKKYKGRTNILGSIRHWMIIKDYEKFASNVDFSWTFTINSYLKHYFNKQEISKIKKLFSVEPEDVFDDEK